MPTLVFVGWLSTKVLQIKLGFLGLVTFNQNQPFILTRQCYAQCADNL